MLVLSRHANEGVTITVGCEKVHVMVIAVRGDKVRLGFQAASHVSIHRDEVEAAINREALNQLEASK